VACLPPRHSSLSRSGSLVLRRRVVTQILHRLLVSYHVAVACGLATTTANRDQGAEAALPCVPWSVPPAATKAARQRHQHQLNGHTQVGRSLPSVRSPSLSRAPPAVPHLHAWDDLGQQQPAGEHDTANLEETQSIQRLGLGCCEFGLPFEPLALHAKVKKYLLYVNWHKTNSKLRSTTCRCRFRRATVSPLSCTTYGLLEVGTAWAGRCLVSYSLVYRPMTLRR